MPVVTILGMTKKRPFWEFIYIVVLYIVFLFKGFFSNILSLATSVSQEDRPSSGGDRKKWETGVPLVLSVAQQTLEQTCIATIGELTSP